LVFLRNYWKAEFIHSLTFRGLAKVGTFMQKSPIEKLLFKYKTKYRTNQKTPTFAKPMLAEVPMINFFSKKAILQFAVNFSELVDQLNTLQFDS